MTICSKCHKDVTSLIMEGLLCDLGCKVYPPPTECCVDGKEHEFVTEPDIKPVEEKS